MVAVHLWISSSYLLYTISFEMKMRYDNPATILCILLCSVETLHTVRWFFPGKKI